VSVVFLAAARAKIKVVRDAHPAWQAPLAMFGEFILTE